MKNILTVAIIVSALLVSSCKTAMITKSPSEVRAMTTKQFESSKDLVFKASISLLQSESYLVEDANKETGLINASKRLENKNAKLQRALLGASKDANTSKASFYIEEINPNLSEVKITLYEGSETTTNSGWGGQNKESNAKMVYEAKIYNDWFNNLRAEIERRKALTN